MCMPGAKSGAGGSAASEPNYYNYDHLKGPGQNGSGGTGWQFVGERVKQADGTYRQLVRQSGVVSNAGRGTGSAQERWILARPPEAKPVKPVVKPPVKTPNIKVDPATKATNGPVTPYSGPNKLRTGPGGGSYDNVFAKWGETYFNANKVNEENSNVRLGRGRYVGATPTSATFGGTA